MDWLDDFDRRVTRRATTRDEERRLRWNQKGMLWWLAIPQIPALMLVLVALFFTVGNDREDRRVAALLERDGVVVDGSAIHFKFRVRTDFLFGEQVQVAFETEDGVKMTTWIPNMTAVQEGPVSVRYLRSDPTVARLEAEPAPRRGRSLVALVIYAGVVVILAPMTLYARHRSLSKP